MFLGAMIMGPLGGYTMRRLDERWDGKIKPGFEMLVNNFSAGIWGMILAIGGFLIAGPFVEAFSDLAGNVVDFLVDNSLLPLTSIFVEPAKVLFLNNAINHGIFTPLGTTEAAEQGQSILFLIEANPGPGFGLLIAFSIFGKGLAKASAPGAAVIQFFGGIHEIYFPYVLMKPKMILAVVLGGMSGVAVNLIFDSGLRAPAAPGSIIAVWLQAPASSLVGVTLSVIVAAGVSFTVAEHAAQDGAERRRGRPRRSHREHGGDEGQEVGRLVGPRVRPERGHQVDRVRLRRRHGFLRDGRIRAAQEDPGRRTRRRDCGQQGDLEPERRLRPRGHPSGPHRAGEAEVAVRDPRLG